MITYTIKYIESHVIIDKKTFYVWYDNHYIYDFKWLSSSLVECLRTKSKKKLRSYFSIECSALDYPLYGYSKSTLLRKLRRTVRKHKKGISLREVTRV